MKCEKCLEEWNIQDIGDRMVKYCPFCGAEYKEKEPDGFSSLVDCFKYLRRKFGFTIFFEPRKVLSYVSDYMPELMVEKRILKVALEADVYKQLIDDTGSVVDLNIEKAKFTLINDYGLSEKWAGEAVNWLVNSFCKVQIKDSDKIGIQPKINAIPSKDNDTHITTDKSSTMITGRDNKGNYTYFGKTDYKGIPIGIGILTYDSGEKYVGSFLNGRLNGEATWFMSTGQIFEGLFENGKQIECDGILTTKNGDVFKGHFRKGLRKHGIIYHKTHGESNPIKEVYNNGHRVS